LRASDEDRERVAERLRNAAAEGRLLAHELEDRLATALRAQTYGELDSVVDDLPGDRVSRASTPRSHARELAMRHPIPAIVLAITVGIIAVAIVAAIVVAAFVLWGFWLLLAWIFMARRGPWYARHYHRHYYRSGYYRGGPGGRHSHISTPPHANPRAGSWL
jgi:hypothetical protein